MSLEALLALHAKILADLETLAAASPPEAAEHIRAGARHIASRVPVGTVPALIPDGPPDPGHHG